MKDKKVDIYLIHPIKIPPDEIYQKGREVDLITGKIQGVYSDMLVVDGDLFFYNEGQGHVLVSMNYESIILPKTNIKTILVK